MGILKLRDLSLIHDNNIVLSGNAGLTTTTYICHKSYEFKGLVSKTSYNEYGCCTSYSYRCNNDSVIYENSFIGLPIEYFPSSYRNMELINKWVKFINDLFPFFDIKIITDFEQNIVNPEYWESKELRFTFLKNKIYFVIKKDITKPKYFNLFQLSLLRYLCSNEYYFMVYDCLRLREKKSLNHLTNWEIMNIARFGVQINSTQFKHSHQYLSCYNYAFLRDYRSPIFNNYFTHKLCSEEEVINNLNEGHSQNRSCMKEYLAIDVIYLMKLFELGHYHKLYKFLTTTNKKLIIPLNYTNNELSKFVTKTYNDNVSFVALNNRPNFKYKEYEKTL